MTSESERPARDAGASPVGTSPVGTGAPRQQVPRQAGADNAPRYRRSRPRGAVIGFRVLAAVLMMVSGVWGFFDWALLTPPREYA